MRSRQAEDLAADRAQFLASRAVSRETVASLDLYAAELLKWQSAINLVGPATVSALWTRHFADSLQLLDASPDALRWIDLGSGAGFPGLVLAIAMTGRPGAAVTLVESNGKKASFLQAVTRLTGAPANVRLGRIEAVVPAISTAPEIVTARALAPMSQLLAWAEPLLKKGAVGVFPKGRGLDSELEHAARYWDFTSERIPSLVSESSWIVKITGLARKGKDSGSNVPNTGGES